MQLIKAFRIISLHNDYFCTLDFYFSFYFYNRPKIENTNIKTGNLKIYFVTVKQYTSMLLVQFNILRNKITASTANELLSNTSGLQT